VQLSARSLYSEAKLELLIARLLLLLLRMFIEGKAAMVANLSGRGFFDLPHCSNFLFVIAM
jgi:hypothetical protein